MKAGKQRENIQLVWWISKEMTALECEKIVQFVNKSEIGQPGVFIPVEPWRKLHKTGDKNDQIKKDKVLDQSS